MRTFFKSLGAIGCTAFALLLVVVGVGVVYIALGDVGGGSWGKFSNRPVATWNDDGRNMTIESDFAYIDPRGKRWDAPKGSIVNGASIPRSLITTLLMQLEVNQSNSVIRNRFATDYGTMTEVDERRLQRQNAMPANTDVVNRWRFVRLGAVRHS